MPSQLGGAATRYVFFAQSQETTHCFVHNNCKLILMKVDQPKMKYEKVYRISIVVRKMQCSLTSILSESMMVFNR